MNRGTISLITAAMAFVASGKISASEQGTKRCVPLPTGSRYKDRLEAAPTSRQMRRWQEREKAKRDAQGGAK